jgi:surface polysaccharide O-acyltransferase-like enzyme
MENEKNEEKKSHIFEIDFLRTITVFSVVAIHSFSTLSYLYQKSWFSTELIALFIHALHYNREMFIFVTGLVLTYVYYHRKFSTVKFWSKRLLLIFIPYALWSLLYMKVDNPTLSWDKSLQLFWTDLITGNASYQLYYILLALQYYLFFPFFLWLIRKVHAYPFTTLVISFVLQLVMIYVDFNYLQKGPLTHNDFVKLYLLPYQDRFFLTYQFFFIFGSVVAVYMDSAYKWLQKYGRFLPYVFVVSLAVYAVYFYHQLDIKESLSYALGVLQPSVVIYSIVLIVFFSWLAIIWAKKKRAFTLIKGISDTSFGIFFVHVMILNFIVQHIFPTIPTSIPILERIILVDLGTFISSLIICLLLIKTRYLSWTIGRIGKIK